MLVVGAESQAMLKDIFDHFSAIHIVESIDFLYDFCCIHGEDSEDVREIDNLLFTEKQALGDLVKNGAETVAGVFGFG
jgi:hypothetical protein